MPQRVAAGQYFSAPVLPAAAMPLPPIEKPDGPATKNARDTRTLSIVPRAGLAVVHFPTTTSEFKCFPDPRTQHEGEPAVSVKFIAQQFIWSTSVQDVVPFLQRVQLEGAQRGLYYPEPLPSSPSLESYLAHYAAVPLVSADE